MIWPTRSHLNFTGVSEFKLSSLIHSMSGEDFKNLDFYIDQNHENSEILESLKKYSPDKVKLFTDDESYYLSFKDGYLCILFGNQKPIKVDFLSPALRKIFGQISKKDIFCKALGFKDEVNCIYDLTAGFGQDTFSVSKFVNQVVWVERNPLVCLLLDDGLRRLKIQYPDLSSKFKIIYKDGLEFLKIESIEDKSTLYFDFMFENKKSKSNKEMSFLKHITDGQTPIDIATYIHDSVLLSKKRIVLKAKGFESEKIKPKHFFAGKTVSYFVF